MISIIIPVYNAHKYIARTIDCCLNQIYNDFEVIAVNDGSIDISAEILDHYASIDNRIKVIHTDNQGVTLARKTAVDIASGEWLFFLDADDTIPTFALEKLFGVATKGDIDLVIGDFTYLTERGEFLRIHTNSIIDGDATKSALNFNCYANIWGRLIKKELYDKIIWPSSEIQIGEDLICGFQLLTNSKKTVLLGEPIYNYIQYPDSAINSCNPQKVASMVSYFIWIDKYFDTFNNWREDADFFLLNEYFAYLRYGGIYSGWGKIKVIYQRTRTVPLKLRLAYSPIGVWFIKLLNFAR